MKMIRIINIKFNISVMSFFPLFAIWYRIAKVVLLFYLMYVNYNTPSLCWLPISSVSKFISLDLFIILKIACTPDHLWAFNCINITQLSINQYLTFGKLILFFSIAIK